MIGICEGEEQLIFYAYAKTDVGLHIAINPAIAVPFAHDERRSSNAISIALFDTFANAGKTVPHPTDWSTWIPPARHVTGHKTESAFIKKYRCAECELQDGILTLWPMKNLGAKGGYQRILDRAVVVPVDSKELSQVILDVLDGSTYFQ